MLLKRRLGSIPTSRMQKKAVHESVLYCVCSQGNRLPVYEAYKKRKKERKKFVRLNKKDHIKDVRKNSPLAHRLELSPYKREKKVRPLHGLPYAPMVEMVKTPPSQGGSCGFDPRWEYHFDFLAFWLKRLF